MVYWISDDQPFSTITMSVWCIHRALGASVDEGSSVSVQTTSSTFCAAAGRERVTLWTVQDVVDFVSVVPGCSRYAEVD